ncbi:hypothetical protein C7448_101374 [Tenacibaculum gallaicum]|uniref:Uncharacterized protein n=1 Tax=Tenacibaculum gallaicum TaxID=561505 RepID=A0A3E0IC63_9FLAO|nr:hypothetical protein C7448_101374 [Tenacibaculum gallaicum]
MSKTILSFIDLFFLFYKYFLFFFIFFNTFYKNTPIYLFKERKTIIIIIVLIKNKNALKRLKKPVFY